MKSLKNIMLVLLSSLFVLLGFAGTASAAVDVSAAVSSITGDGVAAVSAIGVALLTLSGVAIAFKWAKAAIFG